MNIAGIDDMIRVCDYASSMSFVSNPGKRCFIVSFPPTSVKRVHLKRGCSNGQALSLSFFLWTQSLFKTDILKIVLFFWMFHLLNVWPEMIWSPLFSRTFYFSGHHGDASILIEFELEENSQLSVIGVLCFKDCIIMGTLVPCGDLRVIQYLAFRESRISELRLSSSLNELWSLALTRTEESIQFLVLVFDESLCLFRGFSAQVYGRAICSREDWAVYVL